jgi:predicted deacylase
MRGRLSLGFMNVAAYDRFDPSDPAASRFVEEDFNRVWSVEVLDGPRDSVELARARVVRPFIDTVDLLLDLHSMQHPTAPLLLAGPLDKGVELARQVGVPQVVMRDKGHAAGRRLRDYGGFGDPAGARNALLVECGQHWETEAAPVAITTALRFLHSTGVVDAKWGADYLAARPLPQTQQVLQVTQAITVRTDRFVFAGDYRGLEVIGRAGTRIADDGDDPVLTPYDDCVLVMPSRRTRPGETAVRLGRYL